MTDLKNILGPVTPDLLESRYSVAVARHKGALHWLLADHDNLVLDWEKWRHEFVAAGYQVPDQNATAPERFGIVIVDENSAEEFLRAPVAHKVSLQFLRDALLERFPSAQSWWDVSFLFPVAFIDFDNKRFAGFYYTGPRLERYVPEGWVGEFVDFANTYPEEVFPAAAKFWIVDGRNLLHELNERGRTIEEARSKSDG